MTPAARATALMLAAFGAAFERDRATGGPLRCALGVLHDADHECGLVAWPQTAKEERAKWATPVA